MYSLYPSKYGQSWHVANYLSLPGVYVMTFIIISAGTGIHSSDVLAYMHFCYIHFQEQGNKTCRILLIIYPMVHKAQISNNFSILWYFLLMYFIAAVAWKQKRLIMEYITISNSGVQWSLQEATPWVETNLWGETSYSVSVPTQHSLIYRYISEQRPPLRRDYLLMHTGWFSREFYCMVF